MAPAILRLRNDHSALMPASLITLLILAMSAFIQAENSPGEVGLTSDPAVKNLSLTSPWFTTRETSWLTRLMIASGVLAGAHIPVIDISSYPGIVAVTVGRPGNSVEGWALV